MTAIEHYQGHQAPTSLTMPDDREFGRLVRTAEMYAKSGLLLPHFRGKPEAVMAAALTCWSVDMPVNLQTINQFYEVNGRIQPGTQFCVALAARHGIELWFDNACDDRHAIAYAMRGPNGRVHRYEYTLSMADKAKLTGKDVWKQHPEIMLRYRAASRILRTAFPETLMGLPPSVIDEGAEPVSRSELEARAVDVAEPEPPALEVIDVTEATEGGDPPADDTEPEVMPEEWRTRFTAGCATQLWPDEDMAIVGDKTAALIAYATDDRIAEVANILVSEKAAIEQAFRGLKSGELVVTETAMGWVVSKAGEEPF